MCTPQARAFAVLSGTGKRLGEHVVETNGQALAPQLKTIPGKRHVCLEEGTQSAWLYEILSPHAEEVIVVMVPESRGQKSDEKDAFELAEQLRTGALKKRVFKEVGEYGTLRELGRTHAMVVQDVVRVQNRIRALLRSRGIAPTSKNVYSEKGREELLAELPVCSGAPSACLATCGDDLVVGAEGCDDGGLVAGDGCSVACAVEMGWTCMGLPSVCSTICGDGAIVGAEACDDMDTMGSDGCSALCAIELGYQCTGMPSTCTVVCGDGVMGPGETCDDGDAAGGDGCSAACAIESGYACTGTPSTCAPVCGDGVQVGAEQCDDGNMANNDCCSSVCQLEGCEVEINDTYPQANDFNTLSVNGKMYADISPAGDDDYFSITLATAGQIVATTTAGFTDICDMSGGSGVIDTEIQLYATDGTTSLATNDDAAGTYCSSVSALVAAGTYYVRAASSSTYFPNGVYDYGITIATTLAGLGESWLTAQPIAGSGPIAPTSALRLSAPSCFPAAGNVHWYSYVSQNGQVTVSGDAAGYVSLFNAVGTQSSCSTNALTTPVSALPGAGTTVYIAVESPSAITALTIVDSVYGGVGSTLTNMNITGLSTTDCELAVSGTQLFMTSSSTVYVAPKAGNAAAVISPAAITSTHVGYDGVFVNNSLFTLDTTTSTSASRLFKVYDEPTNTWAPTSWDLTPTYPASSAAQTVTFDGTKLIYATYLSSTSTGTASFYSVSPAAPGTPILLGTNPNIFAVTGMAADASYFYVNGRLQSTDAHGLYRVNRADITGPVTTLYTTTSGSNLHTSVAVDNTNAASYVYFRPTSGVPSDIHVVQNASSGAPSYVGVICTEGTTSDYAMTYDPSDNSIYLFSTETVSAGAIWKLQ